MLTRRQRPRLRLSRPDSLLTACIVALLAFPPLAWLAAGSQPSAPPPDAVAARAAAVRPAAPRAQRVRDVPVFARQPQLAPVLEDAKAMRFTLEAAMASVLGAEDADRLMRIVRDRDAELAIRGWDGDAVLDPATVPYPYRYPDIERLLPARFDDVRAAGDLGALLVVAAAAHPGGFEQPAPFPNAARVAFAVLDRARAGGDCRAQLNLAFLLSADQLPRDNDVAREYERAAERCAGDPTPRWLLGQFQSQRAFLYDYVARAGQQIPRSERLRRPVATFRALQRSHPGLAAGWAGEADAELRIAYQLEALRPFSARQRHRRALALYRAARRLDDDPALAAGEARALAGLGLYARAAAVQADAARRLQGIAPVQARLVEYLERARHWGAAAGAAAALSASPAFPPHRSLLMRITQDTLDPGLDQEDVEGPLSTGVERMRAVGLSVGPYPDAVGGPAGDVSFIPLYRDVAGVTGHDRWCPAWSRQRDHVLAGRAREALSNPPRSFPELNADSPGGLCAGESASGRHTLAAVALLELGDVDGAVARIRRGDPERSSSDPPPLAIARDAQQNLWRFAGDYDRAARATAAWQRELPEDIDAMDRAGEIEYLRGRDEQAARWFLREVRAGRGRFGGWTATEARALLKRGTALARLERREEALAVLAEAEEIATRAGAFDRDYDASDLELENRFYTYHARAQAGEAALLAGRYDAAAEHYSSAAGLIDVLPPPVPAIEPLARPEVLFNNWALASAHAGDGRTALAAARRAVGVDPANPLFRDTEGFALQRLGRDEEAARAYRAATVSDATAYPAWNNLGVALHSAGREVEAVDAFRRAVAARDDYAIGWFNLGVSLERRGPLHAPASQGAFGRAVQRDADLRDRKHDLIVDDDVYVTRLDLSKPLPPEWEFTHTQERAPVAAAGFALALLLGLRLTRSLAGHGVASGIGQRAFEATRGWIDRLPASLRMPRAAIAVVATIAVLVSPLLRSDGASLTGALLLAAACALLVTTVVRARVLAARRAGCGIEQRTWSPAVIFAAVAAALGAPWAPLPVARTSRPVAAVHWVGPILTGALALALLVLGAWLEVPVARALGVAAIVMAASLLTPVEPLDGGAIAGQPATTGATVAALGAGLLVLVGLD